ncbi:MAG: hypothetical protein ACFB00_02020 [Parvularculaceae bacterium]
MNAPLNNPAAAQSYAAAPNVLVGAGAAAGANVVGGGGVGVVVFDAGVGASAGPALRAAPAGAPLVYAAPPRIARAHGALATSIGASVVELKSDAAALGRILNAGYRRLKKAAPDVAYVQYVAADAALDARWIERAAAFMARRPEVAVVEGESDCRESRRTPVSRALALAGRDVAPGEIVAAGPTFLVRAAAFEAAGGFRGAAPGVEVADLCIRLRKRGAHVWRLDAPMAVVEPLARTWRDWLAAAAQRGHEYAVGAALHGGAPEQFRINEQARAMVWGGLVPLFVTLAAAFGAASAAIFGDDGAPWRIAIAMLGLGVAAYAARIVATAFRRGAGRFASWRFAALVPLGHFAEFAGVARAWLGAASRSR